MPTVETCAVHHLRYDSSTQAGCTLCLRQSREALAQHSKRRHVLITVAVVAGVLALGAAATVFISHQRSKATPLAAASATAQPAVRAGPDVAGLEYFPLTVGATWTFRSKLWLADQLEEEERTYVSAEDPDSAEGLLFDEPSKGLLNRRPVHYRLGDEGLLTSLGYLAAQKTEFSPPLVELPSRLASGATWRWSGTSSGQPMSITMRYAGLERVTVPAGEFDAIKIVRSLEQTSMVVTHWYAKGVGPVKVEAVRPAMPPLIPPSRTLMELTSYSGQ